tara:strand:- start:495 stop:1226 length:732 start_codon:yes stop_codon:yes gene_type:complete
LKFFIAAPFGNYIKFKSQDNVVPVTGSWTLEYRSGFLGRIVRILKTMRYDRGKQGWINKLGLPNEGVEIGLKKTNSSEIMSIAAIEDSDFKKLFKLIPYDQSLEINFSCPNLDEKSPLSWNGASIFNNNPSIRKYCIAKIAPTTTIDQLTFLIDNLGFRQIHCCNTLPINEGGLSGKSLIPYVNNLISIIREKWGNEILIIAGGGVTNQDDIKNYLSRGANHISLGTICFKPWKIKNLINESI